MESDEDIQKKDSLDNETLSEHSLNIDISNLEN